MHTRWQQLEDRKLQSYVERSVKGAAGKGPDDPLALLKEKFGGLANIVEWQQLRIPEKERAAVIERFYMVKLTKALNRRKVREMVESSVKEDREVRVLVGVYEEQAKEAEPKKEEPPQAPELQREVSSAPQSAPHHVFWHLSDNDIVGLVSICAFQLKEMMPFMFHPANVEKMPTLTEQALPKRSASKAARQASTVRQTSKTSAGSSQLMQATDSMTQGFQPDDAPSDRRANSPPPREGTDGAQASAQPASAQPEVGGWWGGSRRASSAMSVATELSFVA